MRPLPFKFETLSNRVLVSGDAGDFLITDVSALERLVTSRPTAADARAMLERGLAFKELGDLYYNSFLDRLAERKHMPRQIGYVIAIPTLRCDLACDYCQVSRASSDAQGYDWSPEQVGQFLRFLESLSTDTIKVEFQGGEPTLRLDIIKTVIDYCRKRFKQSSFVICKIGRAHV